MLRPTALEAVRKHQIAAARWRDTARLLRGAARSIRSIRVIRLLATWRVRAHSEMQMREHAMSRASAAMMGIQLG